MSRFPVLTVIGALLLATAGAADAAPTDGAGRAGVSSASDRAVLEDCRERFVIVAGMEDLVREAVPPSYELSRNASGQPLLFVGAGRCERYTVNDTTQPTTWTVFAASVHAADGVGCFSAWPVVGDVKGDLSACSFYLLSAAYDVPEVVDFWREGAPDNPVHHVPDLVFEQDDFNLSSAGAPFHFRAGSPFPSPFSMDLTARETPGERPLTASFWFNATSGTLLARVQIDELRSGQATGDIRPDPDSEMAEFFGTDTPEPEPVWTFLAANRWQYGEIVRSLTPGDS